MKGLSLVLRQIFALCGWSWRCMDLCHGEWSVMFPALTALVNTWVDTGVDERLSSASKKNNMEVQFAGNHKEWLQAGDYLAELKCVMDFPKGNNTQQRQTWVEALQPCTSKRFSTHLKYRITQQAPALKLFFKWLFNNAFLTLRRSTDTPVCF